MKAWDPEDKELADRVAKLIPVDERTGVWVHVRASSDPGVVKLTLEVGNLRYPMHGLASSWVSKASDADIVRAVDRAVVSAVECITGNVANVIDYCEAQVRKKVL